jgi:hypothetical protein
MKPYLCSKNLYCTFLQVVSQKYSAVALSEVSPIELSHDAVSRWLEHTSFQPKDIWEAARKEVLQTTGAIIADDVVLNKSRSEKMELTAWQYSGTEHDIVKGIGVLNILWKSENDSTTPMDYRIYHPPTDGKTKNDHFREMLGLAKKRGVCPCAVLADTWYSSLDNLKFIRDLGWIWVMPLRKNRAVGRKQKLEDLEIPEEGSYIHLRGYGWVTVFRVVASNGHIDYIGTNMEEPTREKVKTLVGDRWSIEVFHRELKQTCGIERCQSHYGRAQRNHIGLSILSWMRKDRIRRLQRISLYQQKWDVVSETIALVFRQQFLLLKT